MLDEDLIRMSRQIADAFSPYPQAEAEAAVLDHLTRFWDPRMRRGLLEIYKRDPDALHPVVRVAAEKLDAPA